MNKPQWKLRLDDIWEEYISTSDKLEDHEKAFTLVLELFAQQDHQWIEAVEGIIGREPVNIGVETGTVPTSSYEDDKEHFQKMLRKEQRQRLKDYIKNRES